MSTYSYALAPQTEPPPEPSRGQMGLAVLLWFGVPVIAVLILAPLTLVAARAGIEIVGPNHGVVEIDRTGGYDFATEAKASGVGPCRVADLQNRRRPLEVTASTGRHDVTFEDQDFLTRGSFEADQAGRYRVVCPRAGDTILVRSNGTFSPVIAAAIPLGIVVVVAQILAFVLMARMRIPHQGRRRRS